MLPLRLELGMNNSPLTSILLNNHGVIGFVGALLIFFSWLISNTFEANYKDTQSHISSIERRFQEGNIIGEMNTRIKNIEEQVALISNDLYRLRIGRESAADYWHSKFSSFIQLRDTRIQIDNLLDLINRTIGLAIAINPNSEFHLKAKAMYDEIEPLRNEADEHEVKINHIISLRYSEENLKTIEAALKSYDAFLYQYSIPKVHAVIQDAVNMSNEAQDIAEKHLDNLKIRKEISKYAALISYVLGSVFILFGGAVEKKILFIRNE